MWLSKYSNIIILSYVSHQQSHYITHLHYKQCLYKKKQVTHWIHRDWMLSTLGRHWFQWEKCRNGSYSCFSFLYSLQGTWERQRRSRVHEYTQYISTDSTRVHTQVQLKPILFMRTIIIVIIIIILNKSL